jgi:hypothetical protein
MNKAAYPNPEVNAGAQQAQPILAIIDADIMCGKDEVAREQMLYNLRQYRGNGVKPLWTNWLRQRADLRFTCLIHDVAAFNKFMLDVVRSVDGVRETNTVLSFGGADVTLLGWRWKSAPTTWSQSTSRSTCNRGWIDSASKACLTCCAT